MAARSVAQLTWNANTEPDIAGYIILIGLLYNGMFSQFSALDVGNVTTFTITPTMTIQGVPILQFDGRWSFEIAAYDTSGNISGGSTAVEKWIVRTPSHFVRRK